MAFDLVENFFLSRKRGRCICKSTCYTDYYFAYFINSVNIVRKFR